MLQIRVDTTRLQRRWVLLVDASQDLDEPLRAFAAYKRKKTKDAFSQEGPGWPGLAQSTGERLIHSFGAGKFTAQGTVRKNVAKQMISNLAKKVSKGKANVTALHQLKRALNGNAHNDDLVKALLGFSQAEISGKAGSTISRLEKQIGKLADLTPAERKQKLSKNRTIAKHRLLGKLAGSIRSSIRKNTVTIYSKVPWAGVHNDGGNAGHGARIPRRTFLELDDEDVKVLATLLEAHLVEAYDEGE